MAKSEGRQTIAAKRAAKTDSQRAAEPVDGLDPAELIDKPTERDLVGPQGEGESIPDHKMEAEGSAGPIAAVGLGSDDLFADRSPADPTDGVDSKLDPNDLEEFLDAKHGFGGADGRNPASDGGGPTQPSDEISDGANGPIGGNPYGGLEGSAGKLPAHQQAYLDELKSQAQTAAANGNYDDAKAAAAKTEQYLIEIGQNEAPDAGGGEAAKPVSLITNFGSGSSGPKQVWDDEKGEVVFVDDGTETNHDIFVSEVNQMNKSGTDSSGNQDTPTPQPKAGENEDREWEGEAPDFHSDFTDLYRDLKIKDALGGDVDPNPTDDSTSTYDGLPPSTDPTDVVANYGETHNATEADASGVSADDAVPDEEFFET